jgi:molybdate/tungstate transport system substrate-binding protein
MHRISHFTLYHAIMVLITALFLLPPNGICATAKENLMVFHAGSLAVPFKALAKAFNKQYPHVNIALESAGSRTCARKITDLKRPCDVMASADYTVIDNLLIPQYAAWNISFATNEMAIAYRSGAKGAQDINGRNWYDILLKKGIEYGHSDPNSDPCGYRTLLVWQLAEKYYQVPGLYQKLMEGCPQKNIRPKETDLIALLEVGEIDYLFIYRSVCEQHKMPYVDLPDSINLKSVRYETFYNQVEVNISGKKPGDFILKRGNAMVYGITIPKGAPHRDLAIRFVAFVVGQKGQKIMQENGQPPISPPRATGDLEQLPLLLQKLVTSR